MSISIYTLLLPEFEFYQSTFDIIQQLGSYLQPISLASCLGTWQRQQWVGLRHPSSCTQVTPAAWQTHGKLITLFTPSKSYVESIIRVRHSPREADVQPNTPNSPEQMRSDAPWVFISACLLAGEDSRFSPEANMNISFSMFLAMEPSQRKGEALRLQFLLIFPSRGHHFHDPDRFCEIESTNYKDVGNWVLSFWNWTDPLQATLFRDKEK